MQICVQQINSFTQQSIEIKREIDQDRFVICR